MIYRDQFGYLVDQTLDGGDSAVRTGLWSMCTGEIGMFFSTRDDGLMRRHPVQEPWNNPHNFSRDQTMPYVAGLKALNFKYTIRNIFWAHAKRFFFAQNFERDYPGTTKYPWPHKVDGKWRLADFADPLMPNHIGAMIKAGQIYSMYWFLPLAYAFHFAALAANYFTLREQNQLIAESYMLGTLRIYRRTPHWKTASLMYWTDRNEVEYHEMLVQFVAKA